MRRQAVPRGQGSGAVRSAFRSLKVRNVIRIFERVNRTITPSADAWHRSGAVLAEMARKDGLEVARISKAVANDILIALSCRETGCVLVTDNQQDFQRIHRFIQFDFIKPWPGSHLYTVG